MLLIAIQHIPGPISIAPGQQFHELDPERRDTLIRTGFARPANTVHSKEVPSSVPAPQPVVVESLNGWQGAHVVLIASGPSLTQEQCDEVSLWRNPFNQYSVPRYVIAINTSFQRAPFADILYACDKAWWTHYYEEAQKIFRNDQMWTQDRPTADKFNIKFIRSAPARGLSRTKGLINQGMNSTYQALNLAFLWGARRFILLGVDCRGTHWHGNHPPPLNRSLPHKQWIERFTELARDLKAEGVDVVNCSPGTALHAFPTSTLTEELAR